MPAENSAPRESEKLTTCAEMEVISARGIRDASGVTASAPESESVVWENVRVDWRIYLSINQQNLFVFLLSIRLREFPA